VRRLAAVLPAPAHLLNVCADRYRFAVGFAASLLAGKVSLLPSTHTPEVIKQLRLFAADVFCLTDDPRCPIDLPRVIYPQGAPAPDTEAQSWPPPALDADQVAAYVFTSGSTGSPLPYRKTWGRLVNCVRFEAQCLGLNGQAHTLVGTVPPQHMYGFESTVLMPLQGGHALGSGRPFYPVDICSQLEAVPAPRMLISTPVHLRALLATDTRLPPMALIVSATAPLSLDLAHEVERRFGTRLLEIYGSTETGQIASRRTTATLEWQLFRGVRLVSKAEQTWAEGGHVEQPTLMCDVLEITAEERFLLHGRLSDLVNIAGKRSSLAYLNHQLNAIPGVKDGVFVLREEEAAAAHGVSRVAALVVAPGMSSAALIRELRKRIDAVFLPRPLVLLERLPRNETGKLPRESVHSLLTTALKRSRSASR